MYKDDNDPNRPCLKCTLKHLMNAKTYFMEAKTFGFEISLTTEELDSIIIKVCDYILEKKK